MDPINSPDDTESFLKEKPCCNVNGHKIISPFLQEIPNVSAFFIRRIPNLKIPADRQEAFKTLRPVQEKLLTECYPSFSDLPLVTAEQTHGSETAIVTPFSEKEKRNVNGNKKRIPIVDGLITSHQGIILGIAVADCAPVWIVEKTGKVGAIVHSGKKGTEAAIVPKTITRIMQEFSITPDQLTVTIGPCIRPPYYEVDFAATIREQATTSGVSTIHDERTCTAAHPDLYYSYRREKGKTGHMLATLMLHSNS